MTSRPTLNLLNFENLAEDDEGTTWEALASVAHSQHWPALLNEVRQVRLALEHWCPEPDHPRPLEEGGLWDWQVQWQLNDVPLAWPDVPDDQMLSALASPTTLSPQWFSVRVTVALSTHLTGAWVEWMESEGC